MKQISANFREAIDMLSHLTTHLPGAFPMVRLNKFTTVNVECV